MAQPGPQLPLSVHLPDDATLENFLHTPATATLVDTVRRFSTGEVESPLFIHGGSGSGKSHVLQGGCHLAGDNALYLPLDELSRYRPEEVLSGVEALGLVALDDLDAVLGQPAWEQALFGFYNRARDCGCRLLLAAAGAPRVLPVAMADLRSRLSWGLVFQLPACSDANRQAILQFRAARRGLTLGDEVARYIVTRAPRDLHRLLAILDRLDRASLARQRPLSIPFVKQVLEW